jgi:cell division protein FtsI (penicillin-binding protein 3)
MSKSREGIQSVKIVLIMLGITLWSLSILARLIQLQIVRYDEYTASARKKQQITRSVPAPRGIIYDSRLDELATSVTVNTVVAEPKRIPNKPEAARSLAAILDLDPQKLLSGMMDPKRESYLVIKRRIDPAAESRIKDLKIAGVYLMNESMRAYPNRELASQTLGFVNMNGDGSAGIEMKYDKDLKGTDGLFSFDVDARRQSFHVNVEKPPVQGHSLILSIDKSIQYITDRELAAGVENAHARAGTAIVMESDTGRILALSNYPPFNCNTYSKYEPDLWRNRAVSDMFEPGSTFKVVVAAAALETKLTRPDELIDCQNGSITLSRHPFRDHKPYGLLTFKEVLEHSSNVGAVKLGLRLGQQRLYEALRNFGFGSETGVDLPGEIVGLVRDWHDWSGLSIGAISFGQEVGVTSMQILTAINAIANGGFRVRPSIVDRIIDENHNTVFERRPERTQLISPRTAETVTEAFEGVVLRGTGKRAALEGYRAAGKTGTAQKSINGRYSKEKYLSSFIGFAPLPNPRVTILVQIDEPTNGYYGGDVSAPYFRNIAQEVLLQLRIPPDAGLPLPQYIPAIAAGGAEDFIPDATPIKPLAVADTEPLSEDRPDEIVIPIESNLIVVPDFLGMSKRVVLDRCIDLGIHLESNGSGVAILQSPLPGTKIPAGSTCSVTFSKNNVKENVAALEKLPAAQRTNRRPAANNLQ